MTQLKEKVKEDSKQALAGAFEMSRVPVGVDEIKAYVAQFMETLTLKGEETNSAGVNLFLEINALKDFIDKMKDEMGDIVPDEIKNNFIPIATDELDAVVIATEEATNKILDSCEEMQATTASLDAPIKEKVEELTTTIFEACNFQDITGQRITKVVETLKHIEERVNSLVATFEASGLEFEKTDPGDHIKVTPNHSDDPDKELINGPQSVEKQVDQDEIDRLLASLD